MSPAKRPRPVTSGGSSSRSTDWPIHLGRAGLLVHEPIFMACVLQRADDHRAHDAAAVVGADARIVERIDGLARLMAGGLEGAEVRRPTDQRAFGLGDAARHGLGAADGDAHVAHHAVLQPISRHRHGDGVIAGAAAEFGKADVACPSAGSAAAPRASNSSSCSAVVMMPCEELASPE